MSQGYNVKHMTTEFRLMRQLRIILYPLPLTLIHFAASLQPFYPLFS